MTPEGMFPFLFAYTMLASCVIFISLFAVTVFLGLTVLDIWNNTTYTQSMRIFLCICAAIYPEIGVMSWALYFGRSRKLVFRLIAFGASGVYLLLQIGWFYLSMRDEGFGAGLVSGFMAHIIWWPFVLVGGAVSFFVLRAMLNKNNIATIPEIHPETS
jgi:hypothetical protein